MSTYLIVEFPKFVENAAVHERNLLERCPIGTGRCPDSLERKDKKIVKELKELSELNKPEYLNKRNKPD